MSAAKSVFAVIIIILVLATIALIIPDYSYGAESWGGGTMDEQKQTVNNLKLLIEELNVMIKLFGIFIIMIGIGFSAKLLHHHRMKKA